MLSVQYLCCLMHYRQTQPIINYWLNRAAESITAQATVTESVPEIVSLSLRDRVRAARQTLALFQHHDGITGTSKDEVRADYAQK